MYRQLSFSTTKATTTQRRALSKSERVRNYLDAWVGSNPSKPQTASSKSRNNKINPKTVTSPLLLSGSSYLIPTLRIERNDTPESISSRISTALQESTRTSTGIVKSMLQGKSTTSGKSTRWQAPIILDLHALVPDGSPHYTPPPRGLLSGVVQVMSEHGIRVVGVTNTPTILEEEAVTQLELPAFMPKGRVLDRQQASTKVNLQEVIEMLLIKSQNDATSSIQQQEEETTTTVMSDTVASNIVSESSRCLEGDGDPNGAEDATTASESLTTSDEIDMGSNKEEEQRSEEGNKEDKDATESPTIPPRPDGGTHVFHGSVRSGQQVTAPPNQSLIIIGSVNSGGEVMSDGDIFVFGKLRGRALAGLAMTKLESNGARIFATSFDPELICIGDTFTTVDAVSELGLEKAGEAAMVTLDSSGELVFERILL